MKERIDVNGPDDELKRLGNTFNNMINRLQGAFDRLVQFVSDASHELKGNKVKITVTDSGIGIPKDEVEKIFDRFYTVDKSRSKEKGGTGLGLCIAKWIVDMHHGAIDVESEEGKYTKITVELDLGT